MAVSLTYSFCIVIVLNFVTGTLAASEANRTQRFDEAYGIGKEIMDAFFKSYETCVHATVVNRNFIIDDIQAFVFHPAKTTVGYAHKFTSNRRFFANLIGSVEFHRMLENDLEKMKDSFIKKMKACDTIVMDEDMLRDLYDKGYEAAMI